MPRMMGTLPDTLDKFPVNAFKFIGSLARLLRLDSQDASADLLDAATVELDVADYDNWNGGTYGWGLRVRVPLDTFAKFNGDQKTQFESRVLAAARRLIEQYEGHGFTQVLMVPEFEGEAPPLPTPKHGHASREAFYAARELDLERALRSGGNAEVVLVRRRLLGSRLAVKFFSPHPFNATSDARVEKARQRLLREGRLLASIRHQNVVALHDCALVQGDPALVLEYVEGSTVAELRDERGPLPLSEVVPLADQLIDALTACHVQGIVHRDVSPNNVVVDGRGRLVLLDFGLGFSAELQTGSRLTTQPMGTPGFQAPESLIDPTASRPTVDIFAVGAMITYLLTGRPPQIGVPPAIPEIPADLTAAIRQSLEANPERRLQSLEELRGPLRDSVCNRHERVAGPSMRSGLAEADLRELLGIPERASLDDRVGRLLAEFGAAAHAVFKLPEHKDAALATLLTAGRRQVDILWNAASSENRCDATELEKAYGKAVAFASGSLQMPPGVAIQVAFARATQHGWISEDRYDSWHPGMASGSGWRDCYLATGLGRRFLESTLRFSTPDESEPS